jgi:hypothetical protein
VVAVPAPGELLTTGHARLRRACLLTVGEPFTAGLLRDHDAVRSGLTLPYGSGVVEGRVDRVKNDQVADVSPLPVQSTGKRVLLTT